MGDRYEGCERKVIKSGRVVIDPEDHGTVERLVSALRQRGVGQMVMTREVAQSSSVDAHFADNIADALRSLIAPPKPPEPQGLGAVVKDAEGQRWVRVGIDLRCAWAPEGQASVYGQWRPWVDIDPVKTLSEGVTA